jgi:hypothetical protein
MPCLDSVPSEPCSHLGSEIVIDLLYKKLILLISFNSTASFSSIIRAHGFVVARVWPLARKAWVLIVDLMEVASAASSVGKVVCLRMLHLLDFDTTFNDNGHFYFRHTIMRCSPLQRS